MLDNLREKLYRARGGEVSLECCEARESLNPLPIRRTSGNDMRMRRAVLEQFWPSRRMDTFDQFCS